MARGNPARLRSSAASDAIGAESGARVGEDDLEHVRRVRRFSRAMEIVGRACIHLSFEPLLFGTGVVALFLHKQLEAVEIGHSVLHGTFDRFGPDTGFHSSTFSIRAPIDEASWKEGHNVRHHSYTNTHHKDPDILMGWVRLT